MSRRITGVASTSAVDRHGDIVLPRGLRFALPIPLLAGHAHGEVIGKVTEALASDTKLTITAEIGEGFGETERVWKMISDGYLGFLSIGFLGLEFEPAGKGLRWKSAELIEVSVVAIPSNRESKILSANERSFGTTQTRNHSGYRLRNTGAVDLSKYLKATT